MKKTNSWNTFGRILLGCAQHLLLALAAFIVIMVFQESIIRVGESERENSRQYRMDPFDTAVSFEETEIFSEMFYNAVSDVASLVALRKEFETNGIFDGGKLIDVAEYVRGEGAENVPAPTAVYTLDDLIRWGKSELEMLQYSMSKKEFVNFFRDDLLDISHYYLEPDADTLRYSYEAIEDRSAHLRSLLPLDVSQDFGEEEWNSYVLEEQRRLQDRYDQYLEINEAQLVDMAFSYLASHMDKSITLMEENGEEKVQVQVLRSKYKTVDGKDLTEIADHWIDYCELENDVALALEEILHNYDLYEQQSELYAGSNTNVQYFFRIPEGNGNQSYTNLAEGFAVLEADEIDYYFQEAGSYLIYSVEDIICESNVDISDEDMYGIVQAHERDFPSGTRIWAAVPDVYPVEGDQFAEGRQVFDKIVLHSVNYVLMLVLCVGLWLMIWVYLTYTAGRTWTEDEEEVVRINMFDKLYTEFAFALVLGSVYLGRRELLRLLDMAVSGVYPADGFLADFPVPFAWMVYLLGALFGFLSSFLFCVFWYSFVRRIKYGNLWRDSFLHWLYEKVYHGFSMVLYHKSIAVRTLLPYNLFLMTNLAGIAVAYFQRGNFWGFIVAAAGLLVFDALVGVYLFRNNAEMGEIIEAIKEIRQGAVEYQLEANRMHGENQEIAEAVNNIGEGIRNAVATSVRDERLKSDLITNVSHDIKTPLTSIINYVDLLKREKIQQEPVKTYIEILEGKAQRLKQLTDDLVEASKISSGNIVLQKERLDLTELLSQFIGEFSDKFEEKGLQIIFVKPLESTFILADGRRMWRVVENLFQNICKYAMPGTRVYIDVTKMDQFIEASFKNISMQQLHVRSEELTERFIRGDESRTTEGSGLGLSIAKNLTEIQGGSFRIELDGDLFKVFLRFPELVTEKASEEQRDPAAHEEPGERKDSEK